MVRVVRLALSIVIGLSAAVPTVLGIYSVALTEPGDENYGGWVLIVGLAAAVIAWALYPRQSGA